MPFRFGRFRNVRMEDVPTSYLCWARKNIEHMPYSLEQEIDTELLRRRSEEADLGWTKWLVACFTAESWKGKYTIGSKEHEVCLDNAQVLIELLDRDDLRQLKN